MIYEVTHRTAYRYTDAVSHCQNRLHLTPRHGPTQQVLAATLTVTPTPDVSSTRFDYFGNQTTYVAIQRPHRELVVEMTSRINVMPTTAPIPGLTPPWEEARDYLRTDRSPTALEAFQFVFESPYVKLIPDVAAYARQSFAPGRPLIEAALDITRRIHADFKYLPQSTTVSTPVYEVMQERRGVCQDFAHVGIACLRTMGLAARYVSGYLRTHPPKGRPRLVGADASHAWFSVFCPWVGWVDFDPTNNVIPTVEHLTVAWGRDFGDVSPLNGVILGGGRQTLMVAVNVGLEGEDQAAEREAAKDEEDDEAED